MKRSIKMCLATLLFASSAILLGASNVANATGSNTARAGVFVNPVGTVAAIEYEHLLSNKFSLGARLGYIDYDYEDGSYRETGTGPGAEFLVRFYPGGQGHKGFYLGGAFGVWSTDWDYVDPASVPVRDSGTSTSLNVNLNIGWKIPLGSDRVYIDPNIAIGNFFAANSDDTGDLGFYVAAGLSVGVNF